MSKVDWSLAPDDATHFSPMTNEYIDQWVKRDGHDSYFCVTGFEKDGWKREGCMGDDRPLIERPKQPQAWSGDGLPPVGTVCEFAGGYDCAEDPFDKDLREGDKVTIIAHFMDGPCTLAAFTFNARLRNRNRGSACVEQGSHGCFRPIKTAEQIARDARESAIRDVMNIAQVDCRVTAARLVDAGFKREACKSDCSANNRGVPELLGACDCR